MGKRTQDVTRHVQSEKRDSGRGDIVWLSCTARALGGLNVHGGWCRISSPGAQVCKRTQDVSRRVQSEKRYSGRGAVVWLSCTCTALGGLTAHGVVGPHVLLATSLLLPTTKCSDWSELGVYVASSQ